MAISVRMDPLLEKELELAAQRQGLSKSQFVIDAVERALGRKNSFELMESLQRKEAVGSAPGELPYATGTARAALKKKLKAKHDGSRAR